MRAGKLDQRIEIQYEGPATPDPATGRPVANWLPLDVLPGSPTVAAPEWADWEDKPPGRSEAVAQGLAVDRNQSVVRLRYRSDVDSKMRIVRKGDVDVTYEIVGGPAVLGRYQWLELVVERTSS
jgi:head-tail adaptor